MWSAWKQFWDGKKTNVTTLALTATALVGWDVDVAAVADAVTSLTVGVDEVVAASITGLGAFGWWSREQGKKKEQ